MAGTTPRLTRVRRLAPILALALLAAAPALAETLAFGGTEPVLRWATAVGEEDRATDEVDGIGLDPSGNTIITGVFRDGIEFGGQTLQSFGEGDIFLASLAPDGSLNWARQFGGRGDDNAFDLAVDGAGNVVISGWFTGLVDFGGVQLDAQGATDMVLAKYGPDGGLLWAQSFGGAAGDGGNEVAVTAGGEVAVSLITEGPVAVDGRSFGPGCGERDSYVVRVAPDGEVRWVAPFAGPGTERIRAMGINEAGEVFAGFQFQGSLGGTDLTAAGSWDGGLVKLTRGGDVAWALQVGGQGPENVRGLAAAPDGAVYAAGAVSGATSLFGQDVPAIGRRGDDYLARISGEGRTEWVVSLGGDGRSVAGPEVRADARGVVASSSLEGEATLRRNREVLAEVATPGGAPTAYLAAFTPDGQPRFLWMPRAEGRGAGALGDVLALSRDGRFLAQSLRFRGGLDVEGRRLATPSQKDSAVVLLDLNGR
jgi:hypothetical protein